MIEKTLAERCFEHDNDPAHDELFEAVHVALGGEPIYGNCTRPDFQFKAFDTWTDSYDQSVEVVLAGDVPPMTREQADKILALGFGQIYETPAGIQWTKTYSGKAATKDPRNPDRTKEIRLRAELEALRKQATLCTELAKVLQDWEKMSLTDGWAYKRRDVLDKYEELKFKEIGL